MNTKYSTEQKDKIAGIIKKVIKGILYTILGVGIAALVGVVVMLLWNWLMTDIFSLREIKYWEAVGLFVISKIFFGGFGSSSDSNDKPMCKIKNEIGNEIDKELDEELKKEFEEENSESKVDLEDDENNDEYDILYEKWWQEKGEKNFSEYMKDKIKKD